MDHLEHCTALDAEIVRFADSLGASDLQCPVPSCPLWSVEDLAAHMGEVHRWAEHLVRTLAQKRVPSSELDLDHGPVSPSWILQGGSRLLATLRRTDPDSAMWAWGLDQHVRFWSRRQLHETLLHRIDLELASAIEPTADSGIAADAIDEFLVNLSCAAAFSPGVRDLKGAGERLAFRELDGGARWVVTLTGEGISLERSDESSDAELNASALELLLVLCRRRPLGEAMADTSGDEELLHLWLDHSALE